MNRGSGHLELPVIAIKQALNIAALDELEGSDDILEEKKNHALNVAMLLHGDTET